MLDLQIFLKLLLSLAALQGGACAPSGCTLEFFFKFHSQRWPSENPHAFLKITLLLKSRLVVEHVWFVVSSL